MTRINRTDDFIFYYFFRRSARDIPVLNTKKSWNPVFVVLKLLFWIFGVFSNDICAIYWGHNFEILGVEKVTHYWESRINTKFKIEKFKNYLVFYHMPSQNNMYFYFTVESAFWFRDRDRPVPRRSKSSNDLFSRIKNIWSRLVWRYSGVSVFVPWP